MLVTVAVRIALCVYKVLSDRVALTCPIVHADDTSYAVGITSQLLYDSIIGHEGVDVREREPPSSSIDRERCAGRPSDADISRLYGDNIDTACAHSGLSAIRTGVNSHYNNSHLVSESGMKDRSLRSQNARFNLVGFVVSWNDDGQHGTPSLINSR